jgi:predicted nucleic acid-binding protein
MIELILRAKELAKEIDEGLHGTKVISEYIFDEVSTVLLARTKNHGLAVSTGRTLREYTFIQSNGVLLDRTWRIFSERAKPYISFTDCNTLAVCEAQGIAK